MPGSFFSPPNLVELVQHRVRCQPEDIAFTFLVDGENEQVDMTYRDLDNRARAIAAWLELSNLSGHRALLCYPPGLEFIAAFFGCLYAKVVAVPVYPPRRNQMLSRIQAIAECADAQVALTTDTVLRHIEPLTQQTEGLREVTWLPTSHIDSKMKDLWEPPQIDSNTLAFLQYTSGSTGSPKGVMLSHGNLLHNSALISHAFEQTRSEMGIFWLPSFHDMGLIGGILQPLYIGRPDIMLSPMAFLQKPYRWLSAISRFGGTTSGGPNFAYDLCVRRITPEQRETLDLSTWRVAFNGAEPVRAETIDRFCEAFEPCGFRREAFYPCYGLAEATLIVSGGLAKQAPLIRAFDADALAEGRVVEVEADDPNARKLVGCGQTLPDEKIVIADPKTTEIHENGRVGEIWVSGPSVARGYWNLPEATQATFGMSVNETGEGPFLRTGDLGFILDNEMFVTGRIKDLIIVHGVNHYPQDIELTVEKSHPQLRPASGAVFAIDADQKQQIYIVQEVKRRTKNDLSKIFESIRRAVWSEHELAVDGIVLVRAHSIPKTSSGKIQRHGCHDAYLENTLRVVGSWHIDEPQPDDTPEDGSKTDGNGRAEGSQTVAPALSTAPGDEALESEPTVSTQTVEIVLEEIRNVARERAAKLSLDVTIADLGLDSLERMEIAAALEERYGARFPEDVLPELETPRMLAVAVEQYLGTEAQHGITRDDDEEIDPSCFDFAQFPECQQLQQTLAMVEAVGEKNPFFHVNDGPLGSHSLIGGRRVINFGSFNYLGLAGHPDVSLAAKESIDRYGTSASASRLVSGEKPVHLELEAEIARMIGVDDALVFASGHGTNESVIGHLFGPGDLVLHDGYAHNSIVQGAALSGARKRSFTHNAWQDADRLLEEHRRRYRRVLIAIEGVYSMDGDIPDLPKFLEIARRHKALILIDEAHSIGTLGTTGCGIREHFDIDPTTVDIWMGTISKSLASGGGYIAGSKTLMQYLKYTTPSIVFSTGLSPANSAASLAAIRTMLAEPDRVARLRDRSALFLRLAKERGFDTGTSDGTPVVPIILGNSMHCLHVSQALLEQGINARPILHPAVEEDAARVRFFINSEHTEAEIRHTIEILADVLGQLQPVSSAEA